MTAPELLITHVYLPGETDLIQAFSVGKVLKLMGGKMHSERDLGGGNIHILGLLHPERVCGMMYGILEPMVEFT